MKILCPTDFSALARTAAEIAVGLARRTSGSIELLHVVPPRTTDVLAIGAGAAVFEDSIRGEAQTRLAAECGALAIDGVKVTPWLAEGEVDSSIRSRANAIEAELIVMGAHGRPRFERFVLGSAADRTVRRADRPVLIVPPGGATLARRHADSKGPLRLVVAIDGRAASHGALDFVKSLRNRTVCDITFLRLYWPTEEYARLGLTGARDLAAADPEVTADLTRALVKEVGVVPGSGDTSFAVQATWGDPARAILDFAHGAECDLMVMGAESRRGLARIVHPPVADRVARRASDVPVVFVPATQSASGAVEPPAMFTVLAPTDLSAAGNRAVPFAYSLLVHGGGVVELCYVHERALASPPYAYDLPEGKLSDDDRTRIVAELRALVPTKAEPSGITTHVTVIDGGKAARAILQAAERLMVDSIVLGSHGRGGAHRALLGSVSEEVVRHTHLPVLVVPSPKEEAP